MRGILAEYLVGQYHIGTERNAAREQLFDTVTQTEFATVEEIAARHNLPIITQAQIAQWHPIAQKHARNLLDIYRDNQAPIHDLYTSLKASQISSDFFGEFFCWYDHLVYSHAIDLLEQANLMTIPENRFIAAIWEGTTGI